MIAPGAGAWKVTPLEERRVLRSPLLSHRVGGPGPAPRTLPPPTDGSRDDPRPQEAPDEARRITDEIIPLLRRLWTEEVIEHHGEVFDLGPLRFEPKPLQRTIPIEVGGVSDAALRRAGRLGDGWVEPGGSTWEQLGRSLEVIESARREAGRLELPFEVTVNSPIVRSVDGIRRAEEMGVTRVTVSPFFGGDVDGSPAGVSDWAERFMQDVASKA